MAKIKFSIQNFTSLEFKVCLSSQTFKIYTSGGSLLFKNAGEGAGGTPIYRYLYQSNQAWKATDIQY